MTEGFVSVARYDFAFNAMVGAAAITSEDVAMYVILVVVVVVGSVVSFFDQVTRS